MRELGQFVLAGVVGAALVAAPGARAQEARNIDARAGRGIGYGRAPTAATLDTPSGVTIAADGAILIADTLHNRVRRVDPATNVISTLAGTLEGVAGDGSAPDTIELKDPVRVIVAGNGDILIVERAGKRIRRIRKDTGLVDTVPVGVGIVGFTLNEPNDADIDAAGNVYIADFQGQRVYQVTPLGVTTTLAGT